MGNRGELRENLRISDNQNVPRKGAPISWWKLYATPRSHPGLVCLIWQVQTHVTKQDGTPVDSWTMGKAGTKIFQVEALTCISH